MSDACDAEAALDARALEAEAIRLYRRYAVEVVERFGLCPYAERARLEGRAREVVWLDPAPSVEAGLVHVRALADAEDVEVAFLILPRARLSRLALARFVEALRRAHQAEPAGLVLTMEGFHPDGPADLESPGRLVPFVRRTPDPTIQLTRLSALEAVRRSAPSGKAFVDLATVDLAALLAAPAPRGVSERILEKNLETVCAHGVAAIEAVYADLARDRAESYARLGLATPAPTV